MFKKLRNRIIIITMAVTTTVLVLSGTLIMIFSSTTRPEPKPEPDFSMPNPALYDDQELRDFIKNDRKEGSERLLVTLLCVGAIIEIATFLIVYFASQKIVEPVKDSYDKQKLFIANASHELKTPLAVIEANMEALEVKRGSEVWKENIEVEISHANKLVLDLLQLARMDSGGVEKSATEEVDLGSVVHEQIEIFKPRFKGKFSFEMKAKKAKYNLAKQDFVQVLGILLDNAAKYGNKKIKVVLSENELMVINDGATVKREDLEKIFDRFYQTDKTREGSGLGLAIAKAICQQNEWEIRCDSDEKTTRFIVRF